MYVKKVFREKSVNWDSYKLVLKDHCHGDFATFLVTEELKLSLSTFVRTSNVPSTPK